MEFISDSAACFHFMASGPDNASLIILGSSSSARQHHSPKLACAFSITFNEGFLLLMGNCLCHGSPWTTGSWSLCSILTQLHPFLVRPFLPNHHLLGLKNQTSLRLEQLLADFVESPRYSNRATQEHLSP
ncbi:hypothetical protein O6H91_01G167400 [Diphasiastrum complanatum]|uniref:Uncharacterized protein n=1 Tax=Diphasiastrum complanatum TaxID=34168 RepID=A0ACC2EYN9_DIPCM|nr:hypothetical protein O6H91_01G167400 [Diphasiastrum complanatum]